jgi:acetylglutamate kinase
VKLVVKVGGAQLEEPRARAELAASVASARAAGHALVLVHGGGNQIRSLVRALGLPERYHEGLRVTDAATADVVLMVLAGLVNKELVRALGDAGLRAVGLSGVDGGSFAARRTELPGVDLGYVGSVAEANPALCATLLEAGYLPVVATAAPLSRSASGPRDHFYNINADLAAGPIAAALGADALLFLTDVPAVLDAEKRRLANLTRARAEKLRAEGVIAGGMIPKVEAALAALAALPGGTVKIASAGGADAIRAALDPRNGTRFLAEEPR